MSQIDRAVDLLRTGELIGLPTETVYGLAADASNPAAVEKIFTLKDRPANHPVIVHIAEVAKLADWAVISSDRINQLAERFWPGPLTLVLPRQPWVSTAITGGQESVALRVPSHPVAQQVLQRFGGGVVAPSANRFGRISPTRAQHVIEEFGDAVELVVDGGDCQVGLESTILSLVNHAELLRPGSIPVEEIEQLIGEPVGRENRSGQRAPGLLERHYSPRTRAILVPGEQMAALIDLREMDGVKIGVLAFSQQDCGGSRVERLGNDPELYSRQLYAALRRLDHPSIDLILVEQPPQTPSWLAINDRLTRATCPLE